jgi:hypothetical protein
MDLELQELLIQAEVEEVGLVVQVLLLQMVVLVEKVLLY